MLVQVWAAVKLVHAAVVGLVGPAESEEKVASAQEVEEMAVPADSLAASVVVVVVVVVVEAVAVAVTAAVDSVYADYTASAVVALTAVYVADTA